MTRLARKTYPTVKKKFFGLNTETIIDSRLKSRKETARIVLWICSGGLVAFLLILHTPRAVELAEARAKENGGERRQAPRF